MTNPIVQRIAAGAALAFGLTVAPLASAQDAAPAAAPTPAFNPHGIPFAAGTYKCELNRSVLVRSVSADMQSAVVAWDKKEYVLKAVNALSGALRYEDSASGLVWIIIVGKSMLLDTKNGKQLANECRT